MTIRTSPHRWAVSALLLLALAAAGCSGSDADGGDAASGDATTGAVEPRMSRLIWWPRPWNRLVTQALHMSIVRHSALPTQPAACARALASSARAGS